MVIIFSEVKEDSIMTNTQYYALVKETSAGGLDIGF